VVGLLLALGGCALAAHSCGDLKITIPSPKTPPA
jgi:hypothetical protein